MRAVGLMRDLGRRRRLLRRSAVVAAVVAVLATATVLAVTGTREPAAALKLLTGRAWLANARTGTVSQVDGYSGKVGGQVGVGRPGDPFKIVQRADGAYVLDLRTGKLTRISDATLTDAASRQLTGNASGLQVLTSGDTTWVLDQSSGVLQQVDPTTLKPLGPPVALGGPTGTAVLDADGNPWVPLPGKGGVVEVTPSGTGFHPVGERGDLVQLQVTSAGVWAIDGQAGQAVPLTGGGQPLTIPQVAAGTAPVTAGSPNSAFLPVLEGDQLLDVDTGHHSQSSTTSPAYAATNQMALVGAEAYLLAPGATQLQHVNLDPLSPQPPITVPAGSDQLVSKDGLLFVNSADSPQAVVIGPGGQTTPVTKYTPTQAPPSPGAPPTANLFALPLPAPAGAGGGAGPTAPAAGSPQGLGSGTGGGQPGPGGAPGGGSPGAGSGPGLAPGLIPGTTPTPTPAPTPAAPPATTPPSPAAPGAPTLNPVSATGPTLSATWSPPATTGSSPISSYKVIVTPQGPGATPAPATVNGQTTSAQVSGLTSNSTYCAQVQAVNAAGAGPLSNQQCAKTSTDVPGAPGQPQVTLGSASGSAQSATVTWTAPTNLGPFNTPVTSYELTLNPSSGASSTVTVTGSPATVQLATGTTYRVTVKAVNANGNKSADSAPSNAVTTDGPPGQVSNLTAQAYDQEIDVTFGAASANNNQNVNYRIDVGGTTKPAGSPGTVKFTGLTAGNPYKVTVTPYTSTAGDGPTTSTSATPWGPRNTSYNCQSASLWGNYPFASSDSTCGNKPGYSVSTVQSQTPNVWVTGAAPPGSEVLYTGVIGTQVPVSHPVTGTQQDSQYYSVAGPNDTPAGWSHGAAGSMTRMAYVFPSQAAAGPGSTEWCRVYHPDNSYPWFNIYPVNQIPSGTSGCQAGSYFWN